MKAPFRHLALMLLLALPAAGDPAGKAVELEARLKETAEASPAGAALMLELIDGYTATARHDDVIVNGRQFLERQHAWNIVWGECESDRPDPIHEVLREKGRKLLRRVALHQREDRH